MALVPLHFDGNTSVGLYPIHNMPHDARNDAHNRLHARSYYNLDKARAEATQKNGYNSESTQNVIQSEFLSRFGHSS